MTRYTALTVRIMSSWKILAGLSLGVAALLTFRFNRQLRKQNHDLEGELRTLEVELRTRSDENYGLSIKLRHRSEQLGILQRPDPEAVPYELAQGQPLGPQRSTSIWNAFETQYGVEIDRDRSLNEVLNSVYSLVRKFVEINNADYWWQVHPDVDETQTEDANFWRRVGAALRNEVGSEMPVIRSGKLFCKVLEYQALNLQADILVDTADRNQPMFRRHRFFARLRAQCDFAGNTSWIATTIYTSDICLHKHGLGNDGGGVKLYNILNYHMLMTHNDSALEMFCSGGYRLVRCMARLIHDDNRVDGEVEIPNFLFRCSLMHDTHTEQELLNEARNLQRNCCFQFSTFLSTCTLDAFSGMQDSFRPKLVWLIYTQPMQPGEPHDWNPPLTPNARNARIVVTDNVTNANQRFWKLPARKIVSRSLFRNESEWLFPPWSTCVFRLERVLGRDRRNFDFIVDGRNRILIGNSVQVVLIVKAEVYDEALQDHRDLRALKFT